VTPRRIVSLCPSITETLVAIGGYRSLVGVTRYCVRPKGMLWKVPNVGGTKSPDIPRILALRPDVVFANEEENRLEDVRALEAEGIVVDVSFPRKVGDVPPAIRQWGRRLGDSSEAEALARRIEADLEGLSSEPPPRAFRYAYWIWKDPWMTVSDDTYVADLLRLAGGVNVFGDAPERYPRAEPSGALARQAEVHFFPSEPFPFKEEKHGPLMEKLFGADCRRLFVAGDDFSWHGVRTLEGLAAARRLRLPAES
jgi:ABC-type Fe3+-hydroxamate transport system substrate-binding protein